VEVLIVRMKVFSASLSSISGSVSYFSILGSSGSRGREAGRLSYSARKLTRGIRREYLNLTRFFAFFISPAGPFSVSFAVNFFIFAFSRSAFSLT
jgi:hypothetical protein